MENSTVISSLNNQKVKKVVRLRKHTFRNETGLMLIEGYREIKKYIENGYSPIELYVCSPLFQGKNENTLIEKCRGTRLFECSVPVFRKIAYRERPEGLLAVGCQIGKTIASLNVTENALFVIAESIEKPGNLGTILRSSDAGGADGVIICDKCTDISNPNVVRASIGTLFSLPVAEASTKDTISWLREKKLQIISASPHSKKLYTDIDFTPNTAIVVGSEQYGLSETWLTEADTLVRIPMLGQADSLNVASATTILLYEAARQRGFNGRGTGR